MIFDELEQHLRATAQTFESAKSGEDSYLIMTGIAIPTGSHAGKTCDVGILRSSANPWVPQSAVHVRPHLVAMGQAASQASALGPDWQYLSRRFDKIPTPRSYLAHLLTVVGEL